MFLTVISQNSLAGSFYNSRGIGEINYLSNAQAIGLGGATISLPDKYQINILNPAALVFMEYTRISGDLIHESISSETNGGTGSVKYTNLNGISLAIPLIKGKLATALSINPSSQFDYEYSSENVVNDYGYEKKIVGSGGLNKISFGLGYAAHKKIYIGGAFNYNFGKIEQTWKLNYTSDLFWDSKDEFSQKMWGMSWTTGLLVNPVSNLYIGAIYSGTYKLTHKDEILITTSKGSLTYVSYSDEEDEQKMEIPYLLGFGATYVLKNKFRFTSDYTYQPWSEFGKDFESDFEYNDRTRISVGVEMLPSTNLLAKYPEKITYRLGYFYKAHDFKDESGKSLSEYGITAGFGFPYYHDIGRIDVAFRYGQRGNLTDNPVKENIFQFYITISGGEKWFVRRKQK